MNFYITPDGLLETRGGSQLLTDTATAVVGDLPEQHLFMRRAASGALTITHMLKSGTVLYEYNTTTGVFDSVKTGLSSNRASMVNFISAAGAEVMLLADGENFIMYDGTTVTDIAAKFTAGPATDKPRYLFVKWNVVFAAGDDSNPDVVFWCDPGSPNTDWPASGFLILDGGVDKIMGLGEIYDYVFVGALNSSHIITGRTAATFAPIKVNSGVGTTSHWSIVSKDSFVYWGNASGFYVGKLRAAEDDGMDVNYIAQGMQNTFLGIEDAAWDNIQGAYHERLKLIFWTIKTNGADTPDQLFVYSTARSHPELPAPEFGQDLRFVWAGYYSGLDFSCVKVIEDSNGKEELYVATSAGKVYKMHTGYKDLRAVDVATGTDIAYEIRSREETYGGLVRVMEFLPTFYQRHNGGFNVQFLLDRSELFPTTAITLTFKGDVPFWGGGTWGGTVWTTKPILAARVVLKKKAYSVIVIIKSDGSNAQEEGTWIGHDLKHQNISQKQGKAA